MLHTHTHISKGKFNRKDQQQQRTDGSGEIPKAKKTTMMTTFVVVDLVLSGKLPVIYNSHNTFRAMCVYGVCERVLFVFDSSLIEFIHFTFWFNGWNQIVLAFAQIPNITFFFRTQASYCKWALVLISPICMSIMHTQYTNTFDDVRLRIKHFMQTSNSRTLLYNSCCNRANFRIDYTIFTLTKWLHTSQMNRIKLFFSNLFGF